MAKSNDPVLCEPGRATLKISWSFRQAAYFCIHCDLHPELRVPIAAVYEAG